jgi:hypothetical protein
MITPNVNLFLKDACPQTLPNPSKNSIYAIYFVISVSISFTTTYYDNTNANSQYASPQSLLYIPALSHSFRNSSLHMKFFCPGFTAFPEFFSYVQSKRGLYTLYRVSTSSVQ